MDGLRIGVVGNDRLVGASSPVVMDRLAAAVAELEAAGAHPNPFEVPQYDALSTAAFLALQAEAFAWHRETLVSRWEDYGRPTRLTLAQGALLNAADLVQIERVRQVARAEVLAEMESQRIDLLVSPTTGFAAAPFSGAPKETISIKALHTPAWNTTGFPALSVPMGHDEDHLPVGLQIIGKPFDDGLVLAAGHAYQQRTGWHLQRPPVHA